MVTRTKPDGDIRSQISENRNEYLALAIRRQEASSSLPDICYLLSAIHSLRHRPLRGHSCPN